MSFLLTVFEKMSRILSNLSIRRFASRLTYSEYGPPSEVIQLEQFDDPKLPPPGAKIVVKMLAAPVHPADVNTIQGKEVCNGGVACSLLKLGSLEKTVIASLFHSGLHSSSPSFVEKTTLPYSREQKHVSISDTPCY